MELITQARVVLGLVRVRGDQHLAISAFAHDHPELVTSVTRRKRDCLGLHKGAIHCASRHDSLYLLCGWRLWERHYVLLCEVTGRVLDGLRPFS